MESKTYLGASRFSSKTLLRLRLGLSSLSSREGSAVSSPIPSCSIKILSSPFGISASGMGSSTKSLPLMTMLIVDVAVSWFLELSVVGECR